MADIFYDLALSYASEDREYVKAVAAELIGKWKRLCFYDEYSSDNLFGDNLQAHLEGVYRERSRFVVIFVSKHYANKRWTKFEFKTAQMAEDEMRRSYVLPVRLDDTKIHGLDEDKCYEDARIIKAGEVAELVHRKIALSPKAWPLLLQKSPLLRLLELDWQTVFLIGFAAGAALIAGSIAIGVGNLTYPRDGNLARQVGYLAALNWSVGYLVLFPAATALLVSAIDEVSQVFGHLQKQGMLRCEMWVRPDNPGYALLICWLRGNNVRRWFVRILCTCLPLVLISEWYTNNYRRLYKGAHAPEIKDVDWGLASNFMDWTPFHRLLNVSFDFCAFAAEVFYLTMLLLFVIYVADVARVLTREARQLGIEIWPNLGIRDRRRGFKEFEPLLNRMLLVVMAGYLLAYLVRLESRYLTSATGSNMTNGLLPMVTQAPVHSLWEFIPKEASAIICDFHGGFVGGILALFTNEGWTTQSGISGLGELFLYAVAVIIVILTVLLLAFRAKGNASRHYETVKTPLFGRTLEEEEKLLEDMVVWPFGWLSIDLFLIYTGIAVVSLLWYKIGALVFLATLAYLTYRVVSYLIAHQQSR